MVVDYPTAIIETVESITQLEKQLRSSSLVYRVTMLGLLKSGEVKSVIECAKILGYTDRQLRTWWNWYKTGGIDQLITRKPKGHRQCYLSDDAYHQLCDQMESGSIATLHQAKDYLNNVWAIDYTIPGLWWQLKQRKVKKKTGRRRHQKADSDQLQAFKKLRSTDKASRG